MSARESTQDDNVTRVQFNLRSAVQSTLWPVLKVAFIVVGVLVALNTPWTEKYVYDLENNQEAVHFGHMAIASVMLVVGLGWFLTKLSSLSRGKRVGVWVSIVIVLTAVNAWWLRGIYDTSISGSDPFVAALNTFMIGMAVIAVVVGVVVMRRLIRSVE